MKVESLKQAKNVYLIEKECIEGMLNHFDEEAYSKAVELKNIADKKIDQTKVEPGKIVGNKLQSIKISPATK